MDHVPLAVPSEQWLHTVIVGMTREARHWDELRAAQQQQSFSNIFNEDWKQGGSLHARAVKEPACATLDGLLQDATLQVKLRRASKTSPACFTVADPAEVKVGATWNFGKIQAAVVAVRGTEVQLDRQPTVEMTRKTVRQSAWSADTSYVAGRVQAYWNSFWNAEQHLDHEVMHVILEGMPHIPRLILQSRCRTSILRSSTSTLTKPGGWMDGATLN